MGGRNPGGQPLEAARWAQGAQFTQELEVGRGQHGGDTKSQGQADDSGGITREDPTQPWARLHYAQFGA